jgi:regulator of RNase E activity RraA
MPLWANDAELFELSRRELFTAVVGDICDQLGLRQQFLPPQIRPVQSGLDVKVMIGRAMTVLEVDVYAEPRGDSPFGAMLTALDSLKPDEIYVCSAGAAPYAQLGELMCTAMRARGAAGAVCGGYVRDTDRILAMGFPVFAQGAYAQDQRGRGLVLDYRVPIQIGAAQIRPGDLIMGDIDGVLVVPAEDVEQVFALAIEKARGENAVRDAIAGGMSASEAFAKYGIL